VVASQHRFSPLVAQEVGSTHSSAMSRAMAQHNWNWPVKPIALQDVMGIMNYPCRMAKELFEKKAYPEIVLLQQLYSSPPAF